MSSDEFIRLGQWLGRIPGFVLALIVSLLVMLVGFSAMVINAMVSGADETEAGVVTDRIPAVWDWSYVAWAGLVVLGIMALIVLNYMILVPRQVVQRYRAPKLVHGTVVISRERLRQLEEHNGREHE